MLVQHQDTCCIVCCASPAKQQAALVQGEVAPPDTHGHSALTSKPILLLLLRTTGEPFMVQCQTSAADVFELQLPCSMVIRPRKVTHLSAGGSSLTGKGSERGT